MARLGRYSANLREMGPVAWAEGPDGFIMENGMPIALINWQRVLMTTWWAMREEITTVGASTVKKTGKTTFNAVLTAWRWLALPGVHYACANDLDQSRGRHFSMIKDMVRMNQFLSQHVKISRYELEFMPTHSTLVALPIDPKGVAGANFSTVSHTEVWGVIDRDAVRNFEELTPPPGARFGFPALRVLDSYAGYMGESQIWHDLVDRTTKDGRELGGDWPIFLDGRTLLFHMEGLAAQAACFRGTEAEAEAYYDDQIRTLRTNAFRRLHLNERTASESALCTDDEWAAVLDPEHMPLGPNKVIPIRVGLDIATAAKGDDAAVIGVYSEGSRVLIAFHRVWKGSRRSRLRLGESILPYLIDKKRTHSLTSVSFDPYQGLRVAEELEAKGIRMVPIKQTLPELGPRGQAMSDLIATRNLVVYEHKDTRRMHSGCAVREVSQGLHIKKAGRLKVDLMVALSFCAPDAWSGGNKVTFEQFLVQEYGDRFDEAGNRIQDDGYVDGHGTPREGPNPSDLSEISRRELAGRFRGA